MTQEDKQLPLKGCKDCWHNYHCPMPQEGYNFNPDTCPYSSNDDLSPTEEILGVDGNFTCYKQKEQKPHLELKSEASENFLVMNMELAFNDAKTKRPSHLERCLCWDKFENGYRCYVYDGISKYWCTQATTEHDENGDNHIVDYADYQVTRWASLEGNKEG